MVDFQQPNDRRVDTLKTNDAMRKRKKVPRKPGRGLMHWHMAARKKKPLSPPFPSISKDELKLHNKEDDMWMALHGLVYDITLFQEYHPGGEAILLKAAGRDATLLFQKYHAWVNIEGLLANFVVGSFKG
mmetsp:Transcript_4163/g.6136  ORF Transcript_4163/g.6136 Transcript_4163/m.6136 type:complete len:130 (+) Transcript_4163:57-446(+)